MSKELNEAWNRIKTAPTFMGGTPEYRANTKSETPFLQDCELVEKALQRLEKIDNADYSEALECFHKIIWYVDIDYDKVMPLEKNTVEQVLLKAQGNEQDKVFLKNLHNTKVKVPLVSIFNGLSQEKRFAYTEHIYYHWEEMKEALESEIEDIKTEKENLESKSKRQEKLLDIIKEKDIDIELLKKSKSVEDYNFCCVMGRGKRKELIKEEFDTLKEWSQNGEGNS